MTRAPRSVGVTLVLLLGLPGCVARMVTTPAIETPPTAEIRVQGKVVYDGNREYLPRTIAEATGEAATVTLRYTYDVKQGRDSVPQLLPLFNPLNIVGFPIGEDTVAVEGRLEIARGEEVVKTYTAACLLESTRNIFWPGETYSEMRRKGLLAVRDNIENQMRQDRELLLGVGGTK